MSNLTGGSSSYYSLTLPRDLVKVTDDTVTIECKHIINAKNLDFNLGNIFKAIWRDGNKEGNPDSYDSEKIVYFAIENLYKLGIINSKDEEAALLKKLRDL